ncbi:MAG: hypothetical protein C3F02_03405 [Parcubacteria group bacterium]|nr:MAG: hypothetical protein C3F02_03405 [Parcubacteria group bacterium]
MFTTRENKADQSGFTLIEALITLTVFTIGIIGAFSYALTNMASVRDNYDRYLATNLAREGLELVKNIRDSNWLKIDANDICNGQPCTWDYNLAPGYFVVDYKQTATTPANANFENDQKKLYIDPSDNNFYSHTITTQPSNMYRTIQINSICLDTTANPPAEYVETTSCSFGRQAIGIQAIAHMRWKRGAKTGQLEISENLYNWRK